MVSSSCYLLGPLVMLLALNIGLASTFSIRSVANHLRESGSYMDSEDVDGMDDNELMDAVKLHIPAYKKYHGLGDNDIIDENTIKELERPRCSQPDADVHSHRNKRYALLDGGRYLWGKEGNAELSFQSSMPVTVGFRTYLSGMTLSDQEWVAMECAKLWAEVSGLSFRLVRGVPANIFITYMGIDGHLNSVGRGEAPAPFRSPPSSDLVLDNAEQWVLTNSHGTGLSLEEGICHEMGHTLGLAHSNDTQSVMFPSIQEGRSRVKLSTDDILGIQSLYGLPNGQTIIGDVPPAPGTKTAGTRTLGSVSSTSKPAVKRCLRGRRRSNCQRRNRRRNRNNFRPRSQRQNLTASRKKLNSNT